MGGHWPIKFGTSNVPNCTATPRVRILEKSIFKEVCSYHKKIIVYMSYYAILDKASVPTFFLT